MIFDMQSLFSDKQALTVTAVSSNVIDLGPVGTPMHGAGPIRRDLGAGVPAPLVIQLVEDVAGATGLSVELQVSDAEAFGTSEVVTVSGVIPLAKLKAGYRFPPMYIPEGVNKRYVRLRYIVAGTATAGKITAGLVFGTGNWKA